MLARAYDPAVMLIAPTGGGKRLQNSYLFWSKSGKNLRLACTLYTFHRSRHWRLICGET